MPTVNQEMLERMFMVARDEINSFRNEVLDLVEGKPKKADVVLKAITDASLSGIRRELSGKEFGSPFDLLTEMHEIIKTACTTVLADLKGIPISVSNTVAEALSNRLARELERIEGAAKFASQTGTYQLAEAAILDNIRSGKSVNGKDLLAAVQKFADEKIRSAKIRVFTDEDREKLTSFVRSGILYKFEADRLAKALNHFYHTGERDQISKALTDIVALRR